MGGQPIMDYSKITLGELLSSPIETIRRNAIAILKTLQKATSHVHEWQENPEPCNCECNKPTYSCNGCEATKDCDGGIIQP